MMRKFLATLMILLTLGGVGLGSATDQTSDKSEVLAKGDSPHVRFFDVNGDSYTLTVDGNTMRVNNLDGNAFFSVPTTGDVGVELNAPTGVTATPTAGGSLAASTTYFFVVTALDGFGETVGSTEVTCLTDITNKTCHIAWTSVAPPANSYRVYMGTATSLEDHYAATAGLTYDATASPLPTSGTPPNATTAYFVRIDQSGVHFSDGTIQATAGGNAAWGVFGLDIFSAQPGNVVIASGGAFASDARLTVLGRIDLSYQGWLGALAVDNMQMRSNYKDSTNRLWNTGLSSWAVVAGNGSDAFEVFRAPATAGAPAYSPKFLVTSAGNIVGLGMVHLYAKNEKGAGGSTVLSFGSPTTVVTTTGTFGGVNTAHIVATVQGSIIPISGTTHITAQLLRDGIVIDNTAEVLVAKCSTCSADSEVPWTISIQSQGDSPISGSHTYALTVNPNGTASAIVSYNAAYISADELP